MDIDRYIKEAHQIAIDHGFYDCQHCGLDKGLICKGAKQCDRDGTDCGRASNCGEYAPIICSACQRTGIEPNKNIGEMLMLIISELGEVLEAHRCGRLADKEVLECLIGDIDSCHEYIPWIHDYEAAIKDSVEDELADVFIRLFDFCGYLRIEPVRGIKQQGFLSEDQLSNFGNSLSILSRSILAFPFVKERSVWAKEQINNLLSICQYHNISIEKHIKVKMAYNRIRPYKNGKAY
jgi:NTP pyrophosphatase (non-canonical NTP hydrolase)